jgi:hypothetical protein
MRRREARPNLAAYARSGVTRERARQDSNL